MEAGGASSQDFLPNIASKLPPMVAGERERETPRGRGRIERGMVEPMHEVWSETVVEGRRR